MKAVFFLSIAAAAMALAPTGVSAGNGSQPGSGAQSLDRTEDFREPDDGPSMQADASIYDVPPAPRMPVTPDKPKEQVAFAAPDGSSYSYDGQWKGDFVDPEARVFKGDWSGTVTRHGAGKALDRPTVIPPEAEYEAGAPYSEPPYEDEHDYAVPRGYDGYERCLKSNGLTGAAIGAVLGGIAGNRISGRGDRLGGTVLGAGLGGLAGAAIEKAMDTCESYRPHRLHPPIVYQHEDYEDGHAYRQTHSWQGGYYYYPQAPVVTVITTAPVTTTTTTVTEEVYYETVPAKRKRAARHWKSKTKPRCVCR